MVILNQKDFLTLRVGNLRIYIKFWEVFTR